TANTLTVRGTSSVVQILERIIAQNDKPRAEIVVDVELLEVDRTRAKSYGLNLSEYAVGGLFSPVTAPGSTTTPTTPGTPTTPATPGGGGGTTSTAPSGSTSPSGLTSPGPFNLNLL